MVQLDKLTIKQKLLIPSGLVVAGFVGVMLAYQYQGNLQDDAEFEARQVTQYYNHTNELHEQILQAVIDEKESMLHDNVEHIGRLSENLNRINAQFEKLAQESPTSSLRSKVEEMQSNLQAYAASMDRMVEARLKMGLDETSGLAGDLRKSVHEVEGLLAKYDELKLSNSMLMMRRHEKDFLARHEDKYIAAMAEEEKRFSGLLKRSALAQADKSRVQKAMGKYHADFANLVAGEKQLQSAVEEGEKVVAELNADMAVLAEATEASMAESHQQFEDEMARISTIFYLALLVIGAIVVFILMRLSSGITRALDQLVERMRDLAEGSGDLSRRIELRGSDETAVLAGLVNKMMDNLSGLIGKVQESGIQVASSVTEIAASTREQEATATEHASTTNEVASSVKEISATSKQLGQTTEEVNALAQGTAATAGDAQVLLTKLDSTMSRMAKASTSIADKLAALNEKASNIGDMVTTINKVADQTNLLSLNAAIEAEKAGEYGRGFAVVATEIRRLADQTAVATYDIEQMVGEVRSAISAGVMGMDKFSEEIHSSVEEAKIAGLQMEKTIEQVQSLAPHIESVNEGLQAQIEGASMIDEAMMNLSEAAQQTAEFIRQSNTAIAELNHAARNLQEGAAIFKIAS